MKTTRREFLGLCAAAGAAAVTTPCTATAAVDSRWDATMGPHLRQLAQPTGQRISRIETYTQGGNLSVVRVVTDDGADGWGQISTYDADISASILHRKIAQHALGRDPADFAAISLRAIEANYKFPWSYVCRALTGVDTALWDWLGKRNSKPVCELLGAKPRPLPVYGSSMSRAIRPNDEAERLQRLRETEGYKAFKIRVGSVCGHDRDQWPGRTKEIIPIVRRRLGDDVALLADGNSCYTPTKAIEVGRFMEQHNYCHFEEPCPYWELEWTAQVTAALDMPVAGGEQDNDLAQWRRMIRMQAVDIVQPDICYMGGLTRALEVAGMAHDAGLPCVPHSANRAMVTVFTLHACAAIPNFGEHVELSIEKTSWADELYEPLLKVVDGRVAVPDSPGWGVTFRRNWLERAEKQVTERA